MKIQDINVDGQQVRVAVRAGDDDGVPLLLINGIGASLEVLQPFVDALNPALTVVRFDAPGTGGSPLPQRPYRFGGLCRLIAALLSQLGYETADVLGIYWGGAVAQHFAAFQPRRCRRLVLASTATGSLMVPARPSVLLRMATPRRYTDPGYLQRFAPLLYGGSARTEAHQIGAHLHRGHHAPSLSRGYLYQLTAAAGWTSVPFLPGLRQPVLIMSGDDDPVIPLANTHLMHRLIPDSRLHVFSGGHLGLVTEAEQLATVVERFLHPAVARGERPRRFRYWPAALNLRAPGTRGVLSRARRQPPQADLGYGEALSKPGRGRARGAGCAPGSCSGPRRCNVDRHDGPPGSSDGEILRRSGPRGQALRGAARTPMGRSGRAVRLRPDHQCGQHHPERGPAHPRQEAGRHLE
jgi:poly(3-hydroxyalkanoate) depolymerase